MKFLMYTAMLAVIGCGVHAPVGETRDLVSTQNRLYAHYVAVDRYCVFMQDKRNDAIELLTQRGALNKKQLEKSLRDLTYWQTFWKSFLLTGSYTDQVRAVEDRLAALQIRESRLALTTQSFYKIVERIQAAKPSTTSCAAAE